MSGQTDGVVYYCKLPGRAARFGSVIARQMLRRGFADFFHTDFDEGKLKRQGHGKPYYEGHGQYQFNISHCRDAVAVAVSDFPIGIDVESMRKVNRRMAAKCCGGREFSYVFGGEKDAGAERGLLSEEETMRFLKLWTLKESYVKMTGEGLSRPFQTLEFNVSDLEFGTERQVREISGNGNRSFLFLTENLILALAAEGAKKTGNFRFAWKELEYGSLKV